MLFRRCKLQGWVNASLLIVAMLLAVSIVASCATTASAPSADAGKTEKSAADASKVEKVERVAAAYSSVAASENPIWIAKDQGFFEKEGLQVDLTQITGGSSTVVQAMLGGSLEVAQIGATAVVDANLQNADLVVVADIINRLVMSLYADKDVSSVAALKGKSVAVTRAGTITDFGARYVLKKGGLQPEKDVGIVQAGGLPEALTSLQSGNVQAAILLSPHTLIATNLGYKELVDLGTLDLEFQVNGLVVSKKWLAEHGATLDKFLKAYLEGIAFAKKNKEAAINVISKYTKTDDKAGLDDGYDLYVSRYLLSKPYPSAQAIQNVLDFVAERDPKAASLKAQDFVDQSVVKKLDDSGFIDGLYK